MACVLVLAFHCLLRTGEVLKLTTADILLGSVSGLCRLQDTKSGRRNAANEAISITDPTVLLVVQALKDLRKQQNLVSAPLWSGNSAQFRRRFRTLLHRFGLEAHAFRPYSLRRGGATDLFQKTGSMERALLRGRWESSRVARIYISDGLSHLPQLRMSPFTAQMLQQFTLQR